MRIYYCYQYVLNFVAYLIVIRYYVTTTFALSNTEIHIAQLQDRQ